MRLWRGTRGKPEGLLEAALVRASSYTTTATGAPTKIQLLGQVSGHTDWPRIRDHWERRSGLTGSWPRDLAVDELALNLWPIQPGRMGVTAGMGAKPEKRQPRALLGTPALVSFDPGDGHSTSEGALAQAVTNWLDDVLGHGEHPAGVLLAPPILEEWAANGRLVRRRVVTFGLDWQLPSADHLTWPGSRVQS